MVLVGLACWFVSQLKHEFSIMNGKKNPRRYKLYVELLNFLHSFIKLGSLSLDLLSAIYAH